MHVVFAGDFYQLPPVNQRPVYNDGTDLTGTGASGRLLWRTALNSAVVLKTNHRAKDDAAYQIALEVARHGDTAHCLWRKTVRALSARLQSAPQAAMAAWRKLATAASSLTASTPACGQTDAPSAAAPHATAASDGARGVVSETTVTAACVHTARAEPTIIVPRNVERTAINTAFAQKCLGIIHRKCGNAEMNWRKRGALTIDAVPYGHAYRQRGRNAKKAGPMGLARFRRIARETMFANKLSPSLPVIIGQKYMVTQNIDVLNGLANGMQVCINDVILADGAEPKWDPMLRCHRVPADHVMHVVVSFCVDGWSNAKPPDSALSKGQSLVSPLFPGDPRSCSYAIRLRHNTVRCWVCQLPLIMASVTCLFAQGRMHFILSVAHAHTHTVLLACCCRAAKQSPADLNWQPNVARNKVAVVATDSSNSSLSAVAVHLVSVLLEQTPLATSAISF